MPRIAVQFWIDAYMRRAERAGAYAVIIHKGNSLEGSITILVRNAEDVINVYEPAIYMNLNDERKWCLTHSLKTPEDIRSFDERIARQTARDPDMWVMEITSRAGEHYFEETELEC